MSHILIKFEEVIVYRNDAWWGSADWQFKAFVQNKSLVPAGKTYSVKSPMRLKLDDAFSDLVDVSKLSDKDTLNLRLEVMRIKMTGDKDMGSIKLKLRYPFEQAKVLHLVSSAVPTLTGSKVNNYRLKLSVSLSGTTPGAGATPQSELYVSRQVTGSKTFTTLGGSEVIPRVELCPVIPTPNALDLPPRPKMPDGLAAGKVMDAADPVELKGNLDLNALYNPSVIPFLNPATDGFAKKVARVAVTYLEPGNLDTSHLHWKVKSGPLKIHGTDSGVTEIKVYGDHEQYSDDDAPGSIAVTLGKDGVELALFRCFVGPVKHIPFRANIFNIRGGKGSPRVSPNDVKKHIELANVLMWQSGMLMVPDEAKGRWNGAVATGHPGIFRIWLSKAKKDLTKGVNANIEIKALAMNFNPGVMHLAYLKSVVGDPAGVATERPQLDGKKEKVDGTPSASWRQPSGVKPDKAAEAVEMLTMPSSNARGTSDFDKKIAKRRAWKKPEDAWKGLFGVILNDYVDPGNEDWPQLIAHEVGHVLGLRHRGNGATDKSKLPGSDDEVNDPTGTGYPLEENVMCYGFDRSQDFDLVQSKVIRRHPVTKTIKVEAGNFYVERGGNKVPHFSQGDAQWGTRTLGSGSSISAKGCAITSLAMIMVYYGRSNVTPKTLDEFLDANNGYAGNSVKWAKALEHDAGDVALSYNAGIEGEDEIDEAVVEYLEQDRPLLARVDYEDDAGDTYNHFVVIVGKTGDGYYIMNDPATQQGDGTADPSDKNLIEKTTRHSGYKLVMVHKIAPS